LLAALSETLAAYGGTAGIHLRVRTMPPGPADAERAGTSRSAILARTFAASAAPALVSHRAASALPGRWAKSVEHPRCWRASPYLISA